jgi:hypothetical protein
MILSIFYVKRENVMPPGKAQLSLQKLDEEHGITLPAYYVDALSNMTQFENEKLHPGSIHFPDKGDHLNSFEQIFWFDQIGKVKDRFDYRHSNDGLTQNHYEYRTSTKDFSEGAPSNAITNDAETPESKTTRTTYKWPQLCPSSMPAAAPHVTGCWLQTEYKGGAKVIKSDFAWKCNLCGACNDAIPYVGCTILRPELKVHDKVITVGLAQTEHNLRPATVMRVDHDHKQVEVEFDDYEIDMATNFSTGMERAHLQPSKLCVDLRFAEYQGEVFLGLKYAYCKVCGVRSDVGPDDRLFPWYDETNLFVYS